MTPLNFTNGMRFAFKRRFSPVAYCAISIKTGTRNENHKFGGLAHFTEHLLFKGTETRSANIVNSYIEKLGGELNAFTTKEETVIHATVLKEDLHKAIDLLTDIAFRCIFPEKELEKERAVIIEEIMAYKDTPSEQIFDDFEEMLFDGTPLSMPVLGKIPMLKKIDRNTVFDYYKKRFLPQNMVFTVSADMEEEQVLEILSGSMKKYASDYRYSENIIVAKEDIRFPYLTKMSNDAPTELPHNKAFNKKVANRNHQAHCIIGCRAYSSYHPDRIILSLLTNIIGGPGANSKLNLMLREESGLVYGTEASLITYADAGILTIYFGCDKGNISKCEDIIYNILNEFRTVPMTQHALDNAKKQCIGQITIASDYGEAQTLSSGKNIMMYGRDISLAESKAHIERITSEEIMRVANDILSPEKLSKLLYI